jgi:phosphoglycerate dehydrogenase-like enzyme
MTRVIVPDILIDALGERVGEVLPGAEAVAIDARGVLAGDATGAVAMLRYFPNDRFPAAFKGERIDQLIDELPSLRLIQTHGTGVDGLLTPRLIASDAVLCNAAPLHTRPMAETVMALMLAAAKRIPFHVRNQLAHEWRRTAKDELHGSTVGIVGFGRIGSEVARLCAAFGMRVLGVRRSPASASAGAQRVVGVEGLDAVLAESDWVVLALPLTAATAGIIGRRQLEAMKAGACLINVARGDVVDEPALVERLASGKLAFACLDTFQVEPLPREHPLWSLPNVLVTPHNSASSPHMEERVVALFLDNLDRLAKGEPFINEVDKARVA